MRFAPIFFRV